VAAEGDLRPRARLQGAAGVAAGVGAHRTRHLRAPECRRTGGRGHRRAGGDWLLRPEVPVDGRGQADWIRPAPHAVSPRAAAVAGVLRAPADRRHGRQADRRHRRRGTC
jgi:hypothetical protein